MNELKKMRKEIALRIVFVVLGFALQVAGFALLWRHDSMVALGVGLFLWGYGWSRRTGEK